MIPIKRYLVPGLTLLLAAAHLPGCVSNGNPDTANGESATSVPQRKAAGFPSFSIDTEAGRSMGQVFRQIGETSGGGAVLVAGLEDRPAPALKLVDSAFVPGIEALATKSGLKVQVLPDYVFVYPPGYEQLQAQHVAERIHGRYRNMNATIAVGAGTDLYNALALLGSSLDITLVADNLVAGAWCGELFLDDAPLPDILEAILKSSLILPESITIESTETFIFLRSTQNSNTLPGCLNADSLNNKDRELLARSVSLRLPRDSENVVFEPSSTPLAQVLESISDQLGVPVAADRAMAELPVNTTILNDLPLETALNLLIWQWPLPEMGYRIADGGIQFGLR